MSDIEITLPTQDEIEADDYSTAQVAAMHDEILAIKGKAIVIKMSRDAAVKRIKELEQAEQWVVIRSKTSTAPKIVGIYSDKDSADTAAVILSTSEGYRDQFGNCSFTVHEINRAGLIQEKEHVPED